MQCSAVQCQEGVPLCQEGVLWYREGVQRCREGVPWTMGHGAGMVFHSARKVFYGAGKVSHGPVKVSHGAGKVSTVREFCIARECRCISKRFLKQLGPGVPTKSNTEKGGQLTDSVPISTRRQPSNPKPQCRLCFPGLC